MSSLWFAGFVKLQWILRSLPLRVTNTLDSRDNAVKVHNAEVNVSADMITLFTSYDLCVNVQKIKCITINIQSKFKLFSGKIIYLFTFLKHTYFCYFTIYFSHNYKLKTSNLSKFFNVF